MDYVNFKLKTGEDIIGIKTHETEESIFISNPIEITMHSHQGYFAKSWMMLSDENEMKLSKLDVHWCTKANTKAINCYEQFMNEITKPLEDEIEWETVDDMNNDIEEIFSMMIDSKSSTKH